MIRPEDFNTVVVRNADTRCAVLALALRRTLTALHRFHGGELKDCTSPTCIAVRELLKQPESGE